MHTNVSNGNQVLLYFIFFCLFLTLRIEGTAKDR